MANYLSLETPDPSGYDVHMGMWTNWSRGPIFGVTLTLDRRQGSLLISFTAFFVTVVASRFWRIACSIIHRRLLVVQHRDALHHQRQAIFRNSSTSGSGLWSLIQIWWAWRNISQKNLNRTVPHILFASFCLLGFALASGFSSSISTSIGDEVLLNGVNCGYPYVVKGIDQDDYLNLIIPLNNAAVSNGANYAQQMYSPNRTGVFGNTAFIQKTLDTAYNSGAQCPFGDLCESTASNLILDTGYISLSEHLGVNLPPEQNMLIRKVSHCTPLTAKNRSEPVQWNDRSNYTGYKYRPAMKNTEGGAVILDNYTILIKDIYSQYIPPSTGGGFSNYGINIAYFTTADGHFDTGDFLPEPALQHADADLYIYFLSGNGIYTTKPVYDPCYRSYIPAQDAAWRSDSVRNESTAKSEMFYQPAEAASPLGCLLQYQICRGSLASDDSCGDLNGFNDAFIGASQLFGVDFSNSSSIEELMNLYSSNERASRYLWLLMILINYPMDVPAVVAKLGPQSLASSRTLSDFVQGPLPEDQWKIDVSNWWNISLSLLQASVVEVASGVRDPNIARLQTNATNAGQRSFCQNQKILSTSHISVSVFGLYITYIIGTTIIILSFVLDPIFCYVQTRWKDREYENLEWACNETLQLQRLAYEESGQGNWSGCTNSVPVTDRDQELAPLNVSDPEHPRLRRAIKEISSSTIVDVGCSYEPPDNTEKEGFHEEHETGVSPPDGLDGLHAEHMSGQQGPYATDEVAPTTVTINGPVQSDTLQSVNHNCNVLTETKPIDWPLIT